MTIFSTEKVKAFVDSHQNFELIAAVSLSEDFRAYEVIVHYPDDFNGWGHFSVSYEYGE